MSQALHSKGYYLFFYMVLFVALLSAISPLFISMPVLSASGVVTASVLLALFSFSRTLHGQESFRFAFEAYRELKKVSWPQRLETRQSVVAVSLAVVIAALFFWLVDSVIIKLLEFVISF